MKILLSGASGFIGSHLFKRLQKEGHDVIGVDRKFDCEVMDITPEALEGVDVIYHLAAKVGVMDCINDPLGTMSDNYDATKHLVAIAKIAKVPKIVFTSSCEIYGNQREPIKEDARLSPLSIYGLSKLAGEEIIKQSGIDYCILRYFNIYGRGQRPDFVIPKFIEAARNGEYINLIGGGFDTRSFTYIDDAIEATYKAMAHSGVFNIGSSAPIAIYKLSEKICEIMGKPHLVKFAEHRDYVVQQRACDSTKAWNEMGWNVKKTLTDGLRLMIND